MPGRVRKQTARGAEYRASLRRNAVPRGGEANNNTTNSDSESSNNDVAPPPAAAAPAAPPAAAAPAVVASDASDAFPREWGPTHFWLSRRADNEPCWRISQGWRPTPGEIAARQAARDAATAAEIAAKIEEAKKELHKLETHHRKMGIRGVVNEGKNATSRLGVHPAARYRGFAADGLVGRELAEDRAAFEAAGLGDVFPEVRERPAKRRRRS